MLPTLPAATMKCNISTSLLSKQPHLAAPQGNLLRMPFKSIYMMFSLAGAQLVGKQVTHAPLEAMEVLVALDPPHRDCP